MDPSDIGFLIAYIILVVLSALFSSCETAYSAANTVRLRTLHANGSKRAGKALKLIENYDKLLSTLLVGNNIVNITIATLGTLLFAKYIAAANLAATISTVVTTAVLLIFGEITPKSLAKERPEGFAMAVYPLVVFFFYLLTPINELFMLWKKLLRKIFKLKKDAALTDEELKTYVEAAEKDGGITEHERDLIRSAIEFEDSDIYDIMTPRVNVIAVEENEDINNIVEKFYEHGFSRLPVYSGSIDSIIGIIHEKDLYYLMRNNKSDIREIIQNSISVSETMKISGTLRLMQKAKIHMAVVVDEFGGTSGIVTLEDIIEELVGEIWDEHDEVEVLLKKMDDNSFIVSGSESLDSLFEAVGLDVKEDFDSITVGGWVTEQLEKLPVAGEKLEYQNLTITVTKATMKRVVEVRVKANAPGEAAE